MMHEHSSKLSDKELSFKFWQFIRPYKFYIFLSLVFILLITGLGLVQPLLIKLAIDDYIINKKTSALLHLSGILLAITATEFTFRCFQMYFLNKAGESTIRDLRDHLYEHIQRLSSHFFTTQPIGRLVTRVTSDIESLSEMFTSGIVSIITDAFLLVGIVGMLFYLSLSMTLSSFLVLPLLVGIALYFRNKMRAAFRSIRYYVGNLNGYLQENLNGMDVVQSFNQEKKVFDEFNKLNSKLLGFHYQNITYDSLLYSIVDALGSITIGLIVWFVSDNLVQGAITAGTLIAFIEYIQRFFVPIRDLAQKYAVMQSGFASLEKVFGLLEVQDKIPDTQKEVLLKNIEGEMIFKNVIFSYSLDEPVLKDVSFTIKPGEKVAFVGQTGSGKTTIMKLITRLYDIPSGEITLDGINIKDLSLNFLRRNIGMVSQDFFIFSGTVYENVSLGDPLITDEQIINACKAVGIHNFIMSLPNGYQTELAEKGANISVGQRQLISFARAFAFNPKVLILDEATSNIDTHTEILIQQALERLIENRTALIIAHRLSTIKNADRIIVLHGGKIVETGSHKTLLESQGLYYKLHSLQFQPQL